MPIENKKILILGGTGSLGEALINKYILNNEIYILSRDELKQWQFKQKYSKVRFYLGDIRNYENTKRSIQSISPDIVILCSALKHIDICEHNINECVSTNLLGTKNVVNICVELGTIEKMLFISTDKACHPINVYGMCKSISERIIAEASVKNPSISTKFLNVRYGNVLNSRGSIIPKFKEMSENPNIAKLPVTSEDMTRFFMTLDQSVDLIDNTLRNGESGDTWIPIIDSFKIYDLAKYFSDMYNKEIEIIGLRPGEKIHECLINDDEIHRTQICGNFYIIKSVYSNSNFKDLERSYTSESTTNLEKLKQYINLYLK